MTTLYQAHELWERLDNIEKYMPENPEFHGFAHYLSASLKDEYTPDTERSLDSLGVTLVVFMIGYGAKDVNASGVFSLERMSDRDNAINMAGHFISKVVGTDYVEEGISKLPKNL